MTITPRTTRITTLILAGASAVLALGDKVVSMPGLPGWLTSSWPFITLLAILFKNFAQELNPPEK